MLYYCLMSKIRIITTTILITLLFLFLRFYNIKESFLFFNDMGRDMVVLQQWHDTDKPPLLGPQTSALPFNQSAVYFYMLYPGFLISQNNPISSLWTLAIFYIILFVFGLYLLRNNKILTKIMFTTFLLITIHPQYIIQARFVWNPSFVTPLLVIVILSFYLLINKFSYLKLIIFTTSISLAVSISYSVTPLLIIFAIYWLIFSRVNFKAIVLSLFGSFILFNLSTIFFEIRHKFVLINALITQKSPVQAGLDFSTRINALSQLIFNLPNQNLNLSLFILSILLCFILLYKNKKSHQSIQFITSFLYLGVSVLTLIAPVSIQAHYIFAFTSLLFIIIATLPTIISTIIIICLSISYLGQTRTNEYFRPATRTLDQMKSCFSTYCSQFKETTFVSVQSNFHPFHNGPEHRFLLKNSGCNIKDIETENGQAQYMTVVLDGGTFDSQTKYYELDLFGKNKEISRLKCQDNFEIITLKKL